MFWPETSIILVLVMVAYVVLKLQFVLSSLWPKHLSRTLYTKTVQKAITTSIALMSTGKLSTPFLGQYIKEFKWIIKRIERELKKKNVVLYLGIFKLPEVSKHFHRLEKQNKIKKKNTIKYLVRNFFQCGWSLYDATNKPFRRFQFSCTAFQLHEICPETKIVKRTSV